MEKWGDVERKDAWRYKSYPKKDPDYKIFARNKQAYADRERILIAMRCDGCTYAEIGKVLKLSKERVRQTIAKWNRRQVALQKFVKLLGG